MRLKKTFTLSPEINRALLKTKCDIKTNGYYVSQSQLVEMALRDFFERAGIKVAEERRIPTVHGGSR